MFFVLIRRWVLTAVAIPLAAAGARKLSNAVESRRGPNKGSQALRRGADVLQGQFGKQKKRSRFGFSR
jgi:hypothetical protein